MPVGHGRMEQDYLKTIWKAQEWSPRPITTNELAAALGVAASTVSGNLKKLGRDGLIEHTPYTPIALTDAGRAIALRMVRRHRLIETYLVEQHGYGWDEVHDEAEVLEHAVSDRFLDRIDAELGHPVRDPHGDPIPAADGTVVRPEARSLDALADGECGVIVRVSDDDPALLKYLAELALVPDTHVRVDARRDFAGSLAVVPERPSAPAQVARASAAAPVAPVDLATAAASAVFVTAHAHPSPR